MPSNRPNLPDPSSVLRAAQNEDISCNWCRKIIGLCNGERTLQDISSKLHLPLPIVQKLALNAMERGWLTALNHNVNKSLHCTFWTELSAQLQGLLGQALLHKAAQMGRHTPGQVPQAARQNFLIAVELLAPENQRESIVGTLDRLRQQYAA